MDILIHTLYIASRGMIVVLAAASVVGLFLTFSKR